MSRFLACALLVCGLLVAAGQTPAQQGLLRAAAVVNDEVISMLDLEMRLRLAILATGQQDSAKLRRRMTPQAIRALIDERLQVQKAEELGITVSEEQITKATEEIARRNNLTPEGFEKLLESRGILPEAFREQVRSQATWSALVARRLRPSVQITDEEIDEVVRRIASSRGTQLRRVSEIFLGVATAQQEDEIRKDAERLFEQLRGGANFALLARQFSESATAARGGDLGWVPEGQLAEELEQALARMRPGMLSPPLRTVGGFHILFLRDERQAALGDVTLHLKQVLFALPSEASQEQRREATERAEAARHKITGCAAVDQLAGEIGSPGSGDLGTLNLSDLPPPVRDAVADLPIGQPSQTVAVADGLSVLVVCERTEHGIDRERIRTMLSNERLDMLARRYMRDLRRSANVDIRL